MRRVLPRRPVLVGVALVAVVLAGYEVAAHATPSSGGPASWTPSGIQIQHALAQAQAAARESQPGRSARTGGASGWPSNVSGAQLIATNRQTALVAMGTPGAVSADQDPAVLLVEVRGTFETNAISRPRNGPPITSTYLQLALDPDTGQAWDGGLVGDAMDLAAYGPVISILPMATVPFGGYGFR